MIHFKNASSDQPMLTPWSTGCCTDGSARVKS